MDEIRRKLALIDEQLAGRNLRTRLVSTAPLLFPAVGMIFGVLLQDRFLNRLSGSGGSTLLWTWLVALVLGVGAISLCFARGRSNPRPEALAYGALFCFTCLGAIRLLAFQKAGLSDIRNMVGEEQILATIRGRILTQPYQELRDWCFAELVYADPSSAFYLRLDQVKTPAGWRRADGTIRVQVDEPTPNLHIGDTIRAYCWLHRFEEPTNPGQFNFPEYLRLRNIYVGASVPTRDAVEICDDSARDIRTSLRRKLTDAAARALLDRPPADTQGEAMLEALLLGQRRDIDRDTNEAFRKTGLLHLISLSGMHLSILVGIVWWSCKPAGFSKPVRAIVCILATAIFLLIVPPQGPILRAAVIVWAYCASILLRRRTNPLNSLSLAAIVLLLLQPTQLFDAGWQLSFTAVAGILAFSRRTEDFLHAMTRNRLNSTGHEASPPIRLLKSLGRGTIKVLAVGFSAWLGNAGILLYHFYNITPLVILWTVLASLPVTAILVLGFLKIILSFLLPTVSVLLGYLLSLLADLLIWLVRLMGQLDFSYILIGHVPLLLIVLFYALVLFAGFIPLRNAILKQYLCVAASLALVVSLGFMKWQRTHRDDLIITCLDVGHGQAILAQLPGTANLLFDAGSLYSKDVGTRIISPFLDFSGISRLDGVVASHHDVDHINGMPEVIDCRRVDHAYLGDTFFDPSQSSETTELLMRHLEQRRSAAEHVPGTIRSGATQIQVLWPTDGPAARKVLSENDRSLVCLIEFAGRKVLLCSDIEKPAQQAIMGLYPSLRADVVVVPHHGSVTTLDNEFIRRLEPSVLACSCGRRDFERGRVLKQAGQGELLVTGELGAVTVCIDRTGVVRTAALRPQRGD